MSGNQRTNNLFETLRRQLFSGKLSAKSITALIMFGAIALVFVFFGLPTHQSGVGAAAQVNNTLISISDLRQEASRMEQMYAQFMGALGQAEAQREFIRTQALESLISQEIMAQAAQKKGILATDAEVRDFVISEMPVFQREGRFQRDMYQQILKANNLTPGEFEERIRKDRQTQRVRRVIEIASQPMDLEVKKELALRSEKRNFQFARLNADKFSETLKISDQEINQKLADEAFKKRVSEEFNANKAKYQTADEVKAQHILIKATAGDEASFKKAEEKILNIKKRAEKEDFAKLAKELTEDVGSKNTGGDLGWFSKGRMVPEFEEAAFSLSEGGLSAPIKTQYGVHLIKVNGKRPGRPAELSLWEREIAKKINATEKLEASLKGLEEALSKNNSAQIETILKSLDAKWEETGFVDLTSENIPKLGSAVASLAAFEIQGQGELLGRIVRDGSQKLVIRLKEKKSETIDGKAIQAQLRRERGSETFNGLVEYEKKTAHIERNPQVISGR
jgi:peptidyl-prolyl cis-trans isomerase D